MVTPIFDTLFEFLESWQAEKFKVFDLKKKKKKSSVSLKRWKFEDANVKYT